MALKSKGTPKKKTYKKKADGKTNATGRPTSYRPRFCKKLLDYFDTEPYQTTIETTTFKSGITKTTEILVANDLPLFEDFAKTIKISVAALHNWKKKHPDFKAAYEEAQKRQESHWIKCSMRGLYDTAFAIFFGKNKYDWKDKKEVSGPGGEPLLKYPDLPKETIEKLREITAELARQAIKEGK